MTTSKEYLKSNDQVGKTGYVTGTNRHAGDTDYPRSNPPPSGQSPEPGQSNKSSLNDSTTNQRTKP